jgi:hypothetical protein
MNSMTKNWARGGAVGRGTALQAGWYHWNISLAQSFRSRHHRGFDTASNRMSTGNIAWG